MPEEAVNNSQEPLDYLSAPFIMVMVMSVMADAVGLACGMLTFFPIIGIIFVAFGAAVHYAIAGLIAYIIVPKVHHLVPKLILATGIIIPLPWLTVTIVLAVMAQNSAVEFAITQGAIAVAGAVTGGAGAVAGEAASAAGTAAEAGAVGARAAGAVGARAAGAAARVGESATGAAKTAETAGKSGFERFNDFKNRFDDAEDEKRANQQATTNDELNPLPDANREMDEENFPSLDTINKPVRNEFAEQEGAYAEDDDENVILGSNGTVDLRGKKAS